MTQFQRAARAALRGDRRPWAPRAAGRGTGLYLRAVVDELEIPGRYPEVAAALEAELDDGRAAPADLHARLASLDPVGAGRMEPTNRRRVVRALEVTLGSGRPFSTFGPGSGGLPGDGHCAGRAWHVAPDEVDRRIAARFDAHGGPGLVDEVRALAARPQGISRTARQALGYREILAHLEDGVPLDDCLEEAVVRTRQFARRQASWFRRDPRIRWARPRAKRRRCWRKPSRETARVHA